MNEIETKQKASSSASSSDMASDVTPESVFALRSQYIKDLSFENPRAPGIFLALNESPHIDVAVNLSAKKLQDTLFELTLEISARAIQEKTTLFLTDLSYGGIFEARGIPEDALEQALLVQGAFLLFPYARRIISDVTRDGGFPPLNLEPVDFFALFMQNRSSDSPVSAPAA